jgi:hypothetical protein
MSKLEKVNNSFKWYEVKDADKPHGGSYCKGSKYQFTKAEAFAFVEELCNQKYKDRLPSDFQVIEVTLKHKTI